MNQYESMSARHRRFGRENDATADRLEASEHESVRGVASAYRDAARRHREAAEAIERAEVDALEALTDATEAARAEYVTRPTGESFGRWQSAADREAAERHKYATGRDDAPRVTLRRDRSAELVATELQHEARADEAQRRDDARQGDRRSEIYLIGPNGEKRYPFGR